MRQAGYSGPVRLEVGGGELVERGVDEMVAAVFSLSGSTPYLLGDRRAAFEKELRELLGGPVVERMREIAVVVWRS
jgi:hypothetical protein